MRQEAVTIGREKIPFFGLQASALAHSLKRPRVCPAFSSILTTPGYFSKITKETQKEAVMEDKKIQIEKQAYEKPVLTKHGKLQDITAFTGSPTRKNDIPLGCTRF